jgi:hypothetical protein
MTGWKRKQYIERDVLDALRLCHLSCSERKCYSRRLSNNKYIPNTAYEAPAKSGPLYALLPLSSLRCENGAFLPIQRILHKPPQTVDPFYLFFLACFAITHVPILPFWIASNHLKITFEIIEKPMTDSGWNDDNVSFLDGSLDF